MDGMKEKKILIVILAVALMLLPYYYVYKPKQEANDKVKSEITTLQNRYDDLMLKVNLKKQLDKDIDELSTQLDAYNETYPVVVTQEEIVMLMNYIYQATNVDILNVGLAPFEEFHKGEEVEGNVENKSADETAYVSSVTISYKGNYGQMIDFFQYIKDYPKEVKLSTISMAYNQEKSEFSGEIKINLFVIVSGDRVPEAVPNYPGIIGKDTIISSWIDVEQTAGQGTSKKNKVDMYLSLTSPYADMAPVVIGLMSDKTGESEIKVTNNAISKVRISLTKEDGTYYVQTTVNGIAEEKHLLEVDSTIDIDVYSNIRADANDNTGVVATIENSTDKDVLVYVYKDDDNNPRFTLGAKSGKVEIIKK